MKSSVTRDFRKRLIRLPNSVQAQANKAYGLWQKDPYHRSLHFKRISQSEPIYAVRIGLQYRALGVLESDHVYWFWIGPHSEYDELLRRM